MARLLYSLAGSAYLRRVYFDLRGIDGITPATGEAGGQPQISKNGNAWTNDEISTLVHIGFGRYYATLDASAITEPGDIIESRYKSSNTLEIPGDSIQVVAFDPNDGVSLGLSRLTAIWSLAGDIDTKADNILSAVEEIVGESGGANTVTITVQDADTDEALPDILVIINYENDTTFKERKRTDSDGSAVFSLDTGVWKVHVAARGYESQVNDLTVNGTEETVYELEPISVGAPDSPDVCRLYGYVYMNGVPAENRRVAATVHLPPQMRSDVFLDVTPEQALTDENGYWQLDLVRNTRYQVMIQSVGITRGIVLIPDASTAAFSDLLDS